MLSWAFTGAVLVLPLCLVWMLELNPGTTYLDHLPAAIPLPGALILLLAPSRETRPDGALPDEHVDAFRYAIQSGVLPIASLFSDWTCDLERRRSLLAMVRRILPTATGTACALDLYGPSWIRKARPSFSPARWPPQHSASLCTHCAASFSATSARWRSGFDFKHDSSKYVTEGQDTVRAPRTSPS